MRKIIGSEERAFKGVFIPAELWLDEDLSPMELLLMTEIDSLDKKNGCHATNKHFANFLDLTTGRISQMINSLAKRGHLVLSYERNGKQIVSRSIKVVRKLNTPIKNSKGGYLENAGDPSAKTKGGYLENAKGSNTSRVIQDSNTDRVLDRKNDNAREEKIDELKSINLWEKNWGWPNSIAMQDLTDWIDEFGDELVTWAITYALRRTVPAKAADNYLARTFDSMRKHKITTVEEAEAQTEKHRQRKEREIKNERTNRYGRTKRVEQLPDWAKDKPEDQQPSGDDSKTAGDDKASQEQLDETARLMAKLRQRKQQHQQDVAATDKANQQKARDEGRDKNGLADLLHRNG